MKKVCSKTIEYHTMQIVSMYRQSQATFVFAGVASKSELKLNLHVKYVHRRSSVVVL